MSKKMFRLTISVPTSSGEVLSAWLSIYSPYGWQEELEGDMGHFIVHCEDRAILEDLAAALGKKFPEANLEFDELENTDWLSAWKDFFTPVFCGSRYVVVPPWQGGEDYGGRLKIVIDPKSAFGTGHHASTVLCLEALDSLLLTGRLHAGQNFLDLGCGTGVLGIAAALAGLRGICVDIDPLAVENARENVRQNKLEQELEILEGSVELLQDRRFDLIMANILAGPLVEMAPEITRSLATNACLVLSGILDKQADEVARAYEKCSLPKPERLEDGEWCALVWVQTCKK